MRRSGIVRQILRFLLSTGIGLTVDLACYGVLISAGLSPALSNALSSAVAVIVMYFLSSRFAFERSGGAAALVLFIAWYAMSIAFTSWLVQAGVDAVGLQPLTSKVLSLPISFALNFIATRLIFHYFGRATAEAIA